VSPLWFSSLLVALTLLCASTPIYFGVLFLCVQGLEIHLILLAEALHQVVFVLEFEEENTMIFGQVLHRTGLTGHPNQSDQLPVCFSVQVLDRSDRSA
jgi:hypothetical protein